MTLDVGVNAANAYLMLQERRRTTALVDEQIAFARDVVNAANAQICERHGATVGRAPRRG